MSSAIAASFRSHTLLAIPDVRRSPHFKKEDTVLAPRSVLLVPMFAQSELMGVLEIHHSAASIISARASRRPCSTWLTRLQPRSSFKNNTPCGSSLFRSEKLAAAGQLISDVANELRSPLPIHRNAGRCNAFA